MDFTATYRNETHNFNIWSMDTAGSLHEEMQEHFEIENDSDSAEYTLHCDTLDIDVEDTQQVIDIARVGDEYSDECVIAFFNDNCSTLEQFLRANLENYETTVEQVAEQYLESCCDIPASILSYIDMEKLGQDMLNDMNYSEGVNGTLFVWTA